MKMHSILTQCYFEAAHRLQHHGGACRNIHGHSYKVEVKVEAKDGGGLQEVGPATDMVVDFGSVKKAIRGIIDKGDFCGRRTVPFDHSIMLNEHDPIFKIFAEGNGRTVASGLPQMRVIGLTQEPTAEYMAHLFAQMFQEQMNHDGTPAQIVYVRVWETKDNMAEYEWPTVDDTDSRGCSNCGVRGADG